MLEQGKSVRSPPPEEEEFPVPLVLLRG